MKLSTIFAGFRGLNDQSYQISDATFDSKFALNLFFYLCHKTPEGLEKEEKNQLKNFRQIFLIENCCLNCLKLVRIKYKK